MLILNRTQSRAVDRIAIERMRVPSIVLMENAGRGAAEVLLQEGVGGPVAVFCGTGNNGGDGFVLARQLLVYGHAVRLVVCGSPERFTSDAACNYQILRQLNEPLLAIHHPSPGGKAEDILQQFAEDEYLDGVDWIVDGLLGTGSRGAPRPPLDDVIRLLNDHPARRLALDIPSGLDCDTGDAAEATFRADHTCTFATAKPGLISSRAAPWVGRLHVIHIGLPISHEFHRDVLDAEQAGES